MGNQASTCANENQWCSLTNIPSTENRSVAYGANGKYHFRDFPKNTQGIWCNSNTFGGDPNPGVPKVCISRPSSQYTLTNGVPNGYYKCADEHGTCQLNYTTDILYGADGSYVSGHSTPGVPLTCDNTTFSDPKYSIPKACYYKPQNAINPSPPVAPVPQPQPPVNPPSVNPYSGQPVAPPTPAPQPSWPNWPGWLPQPPQPSPNPYSGHPMIQSLQARGTTSGKQGTFRGWNGIDIPAFDPSQYPVLVQNEQQCASVCLDRGCSAYSYDNNLNSTNSHNCWPKILPKKGNINSKFLSNVN